MFQASWVYKSWKWKHSAAFENYSGSGGATAYLGGATAYLVGSARLTSDYKAISVQLQLQLPTGTELGNTFNIVEWGEELHWEELNRPELTGGVKIENRENLGQ